MIPRCPPRIPIRDADSHFRKTILRKQQAEPRWPSSARPSRFGVNTRCIAMKSLAAEATVFTQPAETDVVWINADAPPAPAEPALLSISEMAGKFDVTPRALRFYESKGLLSPLRDRK